MLRNEICSNIPLLEIHLVQQFIQEVRVSLYPFDRNFPKRTDHLPDSTATVSVIDYDLGDHRIVVWWNYVIIIDCRIYPDSVSARQMQICDSAGTRHKMSLRIFGVDPAFHGMTTDFYIFLLDT